MRVAIDGRTLQSRPIGGVGRSVRALLQALPGQGLSDLDVLTDARLPPPEPALPAPARLHPLTAPAPGGTPWLQAAVPAWLARSRPEVFHGPFSGLPYRQPVPMVVTIYDVSFRRHPEWMSRRRRAAFRVQSSLAARRAEVVLTGSRHAAREVAAAYGLAEERIVVAPPVVDAVFTAAGAGGAAGAGDRRAPYVVALGGARRRRLPVAVNAWRRARAAGALLDLVVVGPEPPGRDEPGLTWAGPVPDEELARLLAGAFAFVYPTAYEGFGLPALEAAAAGAPVVAAAVGALPEVLGPAAQWAPAPTATPMAGALVRLWESERLRLELSEAGRGRAELYAYPAAPAAATVWAYRVAVRP